MGKRLATKERIKGNTIPIQRGLEPLYNERRYSVVKTKLDQIAAKARNEKKLQFTSLAHHITEQLLWESLLEIPKKTSSGMDGIDVEEAKSTFPVWSKNLLKQLHSKGYQPPSARRVYIPKPGKLEKRPINVPTVIDRVLQRSVSKVLMLIYEQDFLTSSFGGRPKLGAHKALATVRTVIERKNVNFVFEADLKNFFGSLNHGWVEQFLDLRVADPRIVILIRRWLKAGHMEDGVRNISNEGAPQGGSISVLISNIYLHYVLDLWIERVVKPKLKGNVHYVRYLDDFVLCFEYEEDMIRFEKALPKRLGKFDLDLEPSKTRSLPFGRSALFRAKSVGGKMTTFYFLGFTFYNSKTSRGSYKVELKTEKTRLKRSMQKLKQMLNKCRHLPIQYQQLRINQFLTGTYNYYGLAGNYEALRSIYYYAIKQWRKALSSRSHSGRMNWEKYRKILHYFKLRKPKIVVKYSDYKRLVVL